MPTDDVRSPVAARQPGRLAAAVAAVAGLFSASPLDAAAPHHKHDAAAPEPHRASGAFSQQVQARSAEVNTCYQAALVTQPALAGRLVVHFTITAKGKAAHVVVRDSTLSNPAVERCVADVVGRWAFAAPENAQDSHVAVPFEFGPAQGSGAVRLPPGVIARQVLDQAAVAVDARRGLIAYSRCWRAGEAAQEGCVAVISPLAGGKGTEIPIFAPGAAPDARRRQQKQSAAWTKLLAHIKDGAFVPLPRIDWAPATPALALPALDVQLTHAGNKVTVTRRGAKPDVVVEIPDGGQRPVAVFSAPGQSLLVIAFHDQARRSAPAGATPPEPPLLTHFEVVALLR
jgi:TonB family protein